MAFDQVAVFMMRTRWARLAAVRECNKSMLPMMIMADVRQAYRTDNYAQTVIGGAIWPMLWPIYDDRPDSDRFEVENRQL
ncbi:hypothetical protein NKJ52_29435 [Mesorhizobium australicum]|uniref:hypothetical protein n=2 Tax=Mesorhizobium TaxID=68287 RepID=UPI0033361519